MNIKITRTENSKLKDIDFNNIPFGKYTSDHMFVMDYANGQWGNFRIIPYQSFLLDPQSKAFFPRIRLEKEATGCAEGDHERPLVGSKYKGSRG